MITISTQFLCAICHELTHECSSQKTFKARHLHQSSHFDLIRHLGYFSFLFQKGSEQRANFGPPYDLIITFHCKNGYVPSNIYK